ncbi:MAG: hypothetical protein HPY78_06730 [Brevinematales bacterium]|nr:hypothetical protein [Brevinematales bacterium]
MCQQIPLPNFVNCYDGLRAMGNHSVMVRVVNSKLLGSVHIERDFRAYYTQNHQNVNQPYWDYGVGVQNRNGIKLVFIEVHCGSKGNDILQKFEWLQTILRTYNLNGYRCEYYFVPTGSAPSIRSSKYTSLINVGVRIKRQVII